MAEWYGAANATKASESKPHDLEEILKTLDPEKAKEIRQAMAVPSSSATATPVLSPEIQKEQLLARIRDEAAKNNLGPWTKEILEGSLEIDFKDPNGFTLMHHAVWRGDLSLVAKLLDSAGCPLDIRGGQDQTPLMFAVIRGNFTIIKMLLDRGADIDAVQLDKMSPSLLAVQSRQLNAFLVLRNRGATLKHVDATGCGLMHWAAYENDVQFLRVLRATGLSFDEKDLTGMTPLHKACMSNAYHAVEYLLGQGCNAEVLDNDRRTPMDVARKYHSNAAIKALTTDPSPSLIEANFTLMHLAYVFLLWFTYYSYIIQDTGAYLLCTMAINVYFGIVPLLYFLVRCSSPGNIPRQGDSIETSAIRMVGEKFEEGKFTEIPRSEQFCLTCHLLRPQRSKHCRICDICVPNLDFHCTALGICIGLGNRKRFVFWLFSLFSLISLHMWLEWASLHEHITEKSFTGYCAQLWLGFMEGKLLNQLVVLVNGFVLWYLGCHVFLLGYSISNALTANEVLNRHRYRYLFAPFQAMDGSLKLRFKNPFFKSYLKNWVDFLISDN